MILEESFTTEWLQAIARQFSKTVDLKLLEKVVRALSLLEQLQHQQLSFVFKGGTSLILHFEQPRRFSIDIDIVMPNKPEDLLQRFEAIVQTGAFTRWQDDSGRARHSDVPVGHYKFYYVSQVDPQHPEEPILLDILYTEPNYVSIIEKPIRHPWLSTEEPLTIIRLPEMDSLLGDKLTAFAPNTTGILYSKERPAEIVKQLFDVAHLFDVATDMEAIKLSFREIAEEEIRFRQLEIGPNDVLDDIFQTSLILAQRDMKNEYYIILLGGIQRLKNFVIGGFTAEDAIMAGAKAAYLSQLIKANQTTIRRYTKPEEIAGWSITDTSFNRLNKLKKTQPEAFFYWYQALQLVGIS